MIRQRETVAYPLGPEHQSIEKIVRRVRSQVERLAAVEEEGYFDLGRSALLLKKEKLVDEML
jgi:hypothetical protein